MGKLTPQLSQAMLREYEVRRQLGIKPNCPKSKGRCGALRAERELARRAQYARRRQPGWDDLCHELQDMVLGHLSLADLSYARQAGLGARTEGGRRRLRDAMRRRIDALKPLWQGWRKGTPRYQAQSARVGCSPIEFATSVEKLCFVPKEEGLPASVAEMRVLRCLDVSRHPIPFFSKPLTMLPRRLGFCQTLLELRLTNHSFKVLPPPVLALRRLKRLDLGNNALLERLPENMGDKLQNLSFVELRCCQLLKALPFSLLRTLEKAVSSRRRHRVPLLLSQNLFTGTYLRNTFTEVDFPRLKSYFENGTMTNPDHHWAINNVGNFVDFL